MNTHFEQTFLQTIIDLLKVDEKFFNITIDLIFNKFFLGRNTLIKNNDLRMVIKNTLGQYGPIFWTEKLLKFLNVKSEGGARTSFQINQAFNLLTFILEISGNKILTVENFKEKLHENDFVKIMRKLIQYVKAHLAEDGKEDNKEEENDKEDADKENDKENDGKKNKKKNKKDKKKKKNQKKNLLEMVLLCMSNYLDRLFSFERKIEFYTKDNQNDIYLANEKIVKLIQKISTSLNYKNVLHKINVVINKNKNEENAEEKDSENNNDDDSDNNISLNNQNAKMEIDDEEIEEDEEGEEENENDD
jgi:hypothetical protein